MYRRARIIRKIRNISITVVVLLVLFVGGGIAYTWYMGQNSNDDSAIAAPDTSAEGPPLPKHVQPGADVAESLSIQSLTSPILPGSNASITVRTLPYSDCTITVTYDKIESKDSGLVKKVADDYGMVSWSWTVEPSVPLGKWPVRAVCYKGEKWANVIGDLVVAGTLDQ